MRKSRIVSRRSVHHIIPWVVLCLLVCTGCSKDKSKDGAAASASAAAAAPPANVDQELLGELQKIAKECKVDTKASRVTCQQRERRKLSADFSRNKRSRVGALDTLAHALGSDDLALATVGTDLMYAAFRSSLGKTEEAPVSKGTSSALIQALAKLPEAQAGQAAPAIVHAAALAENETELYPALEQHKNKRLPSIGYRYLMTYGRMRVFPKIKELSQNQRLDIVLSALEAPRLMRKKTDEESAQVCTWVGEFLNDKRAIVVARASSLLIDCGNDYAEAILAEGERRLKDKQITAVTLSPYRSMCIRRPNAQRQEADEEMCERLAKLLRSVLADAEIESRARITALSILTSQFPDKSTLATVKKYAKDKDKQLAQRAKQAVERLERNLKREKDKTANPPREHDHDAHEKAPGAKAPAAAVKAPSKPSAAPAAAQQQPKPAVAAQPAAAPAGSAGP